MKNVQISDNDIIGNRFNGHDLHYYLNKRGIESKQLVWEKHSNDPFTFQIAENFLDRDTLNKFIFGIEQELFLQSVLYPFAYQLLSHPCFLEADLVHYHLIQNHFFNIPMLPLLSRLKPSIWTLHDPWAITGHCIHPFDCERWKIGCGECPHLKTPIAMKNDNTALNWELKKIHYQNSDIDIVVASQWMLNMVKQSPLFSHFRIHHIPFGVNLNIFRPMDSNKAKERFGISPETLVVCFRAVDSQFKGLSHIQKLLHTLQFDQPICLLTFHEKGLMNEFKGKYQIIDLGWVFDEQQVIDAYNAADILLMPSIAEAFGMMAIEAMACGKPVITFEGPASALSEILFAPEGAFAVPMGDNEALLHVTEHLLNYPEARKRVGAQALALAHKHYNVEHYVDNIIGLYNEVIARGKHNTRATYIVSQLQKIECETAAIIKMILFYHLVMLLKRYLSAGLYNRLRQLYRWFRRATKDRRA